MLVVVNSELQKADRLQVGWLFGVGVSLMDHMFFVSCRERRKVVVGAVFFVEGVWCFVGMGAQAEVYVINVSY